MTLCYYDIMNGRTIKRAFKKKKIYQFLKFIQIREFKIMDLNNIIYK